MNHSTNSGWVIDYTDRPKLNGRDSVEKILENYDLETAMRHYEMEGTMVDWIEDADVAKSASHVARFMRGIIYGKR